MDEVFTTGSLREIWVSSKQGEAASCAYNESFTIKLNGQIDQVLLNEAIKRTIDRHDALWAVFSNDGKILRKKKFSDIPITNHDIRSQFNDAERVNYINKLHEQEVSNPFDLENGPLWRAHSLVRSDRELDLIFTAHHIVCDGWSINVLVREIGIIYNSLKKNAEVEIDEPSSFFSYLLDQTTSFDIKRQRIVIDFWKNQYSPPFPVLELPVDHIRPPLRTYAAHSKRIRIEPSLVEQIKGIATEGGCNPFTYLLGAYATFIYKLSGSEDIVIGVPVAGQSYYKSTNIVGHCVSMLPVRINISPGSQFADFALSLQDRLFDAYDHYELTFGDLIHELKIPRDPSRIPLVSVGFTYAKMWASDEIGFEGLDASYFINSRQFETFEMYATVIDSGKSWELLWHFNSDLVDDSTADRWINEYVILLNGVVSNAHTALQSLSVLGEDEKDVILKKWNATDCSYPDSLCLHELITIQAKNTPNAIAVQYENIQLTYRELDERSNKLAKQLLSAGVVCETPVGIFIERSVGIVVSQLAILKAGGSYVPLDPNYPCERIAFILEDASISIVITETAIASVLPKQAKIKILLDTIENTFKPDDKAALLPISGPDNAAYIIYTSGSTGKPKGVIIQHRSVVNFACTMIKEPGINSKDSVLAITTISFDISVLELLVPLIVGAKVVIVSRNVASDGRSLAKWINEAEITIMQGTPSTWRLLISGGWSGTQGLKALCGGEAFPKDLLRELLPKVGSLWNMYGPTETTVWSTCCKLVTVDEKISIGKPISNTYVYILDKYLKPVPIGVTGELFIGGKGVARGYLNRVELTEQKFLSDSFTTDPKSRMYSTGDLARWNDDGTIECLGRIDFQIKIRGFRIELGEIENCFLTHPGVRQCVVVCKEFSPSDLRLFAYYVLNTSGLLTTSELRNHLKTFLPDHMIPQHLVELDVLPLTPSGKVDRNALQIPIEIQGQKSATKVLPATPGELYLAGLWKEVLGIETVYSGDTFFDIGGHSLLSFQVVSRVKAETGIDIEPKTLMLNTLGEIVANYSLNDLNHKKSNLSDKVSITSKIIKFIQLRKKT
jgi:amino acid adenylation domain-containing protein